MLQQADIYVNDISIISDQGAIVEQSYFSHRLANEKQLDIQFLVNKNIMGLGNTAIHRSVLRDLKIPRNIEAVDWLIFTNMLLDGKEAIFSNEAITFYRQHDENTIGFGTADKERIMKSIDAHYQNASYFSSVSQLHKEHFKQIKKVKKYISSSENNMDSYIKQVQKNIISYPFWWEEVKTLKELEYEY